MRIRTLSYVADQVLLSFLPAFSCKHAGPQATRAGAKRRAEGGYVVVMQPSERRTVDAPEPPVEAGV